MRDTKTFGTVISETPLKAEMLCVKCGNVYCDGIISSKEHHMGQIIKITGYPFCHKCSEKWYKFIEKNRSKFKDDFRLLYKTFISEKVQFD